VPAADLVAAWLKEQLEWDNRNDQAIDYIMLKIAHSLRTFVGMTASVTWTDLFMALATQGPATIFKDFSKVINLCISVNRQPSTKMSIMWDLFEHLNANGVNIPKILHAMILLNALMMLTVRCMYKTHTNDWSEVMNDVNGSEGARLDSCVTNREVERREKRMRVYGCFGTKGEVYDVGESSRERIRLRTRRERRFEMSARAALSSRARAKYKCAPNAQRSGAKYTTSARIARYESEGDEWLRTLLSESEDLVCS
jgi:hypothetical protein